MDNKDIVWPSDFGANDTLRFNKDSQYDRPTPGQGKPQIDASLLDAEYIKPGLSLRQHFGW